VNTTNFAFDTLEHPWQSLENLNIPPEYRYWITLPGSLTKALKARTTDFSVHLISEQILDTPWPQRSRSLTEACFSRKVLLMNGHEPWVAAHTLIPKSSLENGLHALSRLKNRPLGELLFSDKRVSKDSEEACRTESGWGRRARYLLEGQPLLVSEFFLPGLIKHEYQRTASLY
jgi:chorismate--pyruvate lyase